MAQYHLNGLALMHIHRGFSFNIEDIINRFARQHLRKMNLLILFSDLHSIDIHDCFNNYMHSLYNAYTYYTLLIIYAVYLLIKISAFATLGCDKNLTVCISSYLSLWVHLEIYSYINNFYLTATPPP